jgi:hypothetical protein
MGDTSCCNNCSCNNETCKHISSIFRKGGIPAIVRAICDHDVGSDCNRIVILVWYLVQHSCTDETDISLGDWSLILQKIARAAELQECPLNSYWALSAALDFTIACPSLFSSPFLHSLIVVEMSKYTQKKIGNIENDDMSLSTFVEALTTTLSALTSYLHVWYIPNCSKAEVRVLTRDVQEFASFSSYVPSVRKHNVFDAPFCRSVSIFLEALLMDVSYENMFDRTFSANLLFVLRVFTQVLTKEPLGALRSALNNRSHTHSALYFIAYDDYCKVPFHADFIEHRMEMRKVLYLVTTGSEVAFESIARRDDGKFMSVQDYMSIYRLSASIYKMVSSVEIVKAITEIGKLRAVPSTPDADADAAAAATADVVPPPQEHVSFTEKKFVETDEERAERIQNELLEDEEREHAAQRKRKERRKKKKQHRKLRKQTTHVIDDYQDDDNDVGNDEGDGGDGGNDEGGEHCDFVLTPFYDINDTVSEYVKGITSHICWE